MNPKMPKKYKTKSNGQLFKWNIDLKEHWDKLKIGNSIPSTKFKWEFPSSIGKSEWRIMFYPKGQYAQWGYPSPQASIYILLLSCEKPNQPSKLNFNYEIRINERLVGNFKTSGTVDISDKKSTWIGLKLFPKNELNNYSNIFILLNAEEKREEKEVNQNVEIGLENLDLGSSKNIYADQIPDSKDTSKILNFLNGLDEIQTITLCGDISEVENVPVEEVKDAIEKSKVNNSFMEFIKLCGTSGIKWLLRLVLRVFPNIFGETKPTDYSRKNK